MTVHMMIVLLALCGMALLLFVSFPTSAPTTDITNSAFDVAEYHHLQEPYRSYSCLARRIHLSQYNDVDDLSDEISMTVSFMLDYEECKDVIPYVYYSSSSREKEHRATAVPLHFNYTSSETDEFFQSDWLYHVILPKLKADTHYKYRVQVEKKTSFDENDEEESTALARRRRLAQQVSKTPPLSFQTPPLSNTPTTIALLGDLGQTIDSTLTMTHIYRSTLSLLNKHPISLIMIAGDISYADSDPQRWIRWFDLMEPLFQRTPLHVAAGNHEIECEKRSHLPFVQYEAYFRNPNRVGPADMEPLSPSDVDSLEGCSTPSVFQGHYNYGNSFYAYNHGMMKMIVLNSYTHSSNGSPQYKWLEQELQHNLDRTRTPWFVVSVHAPTYNTFNDHVNETQALEMKEAMEPLFLKYGVNLVISGHCHAYMRTRPVANDEVKKDGPIYIIVGAGGNREGHASGYQHEEPEEWIAKRDHEEFGFGRLHFRNATHARWSWVRDGTTPEGIRDDTWILNQHV